jgi:deoxyribonuclease IV
MLIGAHVSQAGGLPNAVARGVERDARSIQIFNQSPRMWRPTAYGDDDFGVFREAIAPTRIGAVLIHAVYLLNCASEDREIRRKTLASLIQSLSVGAAIGASGVVLHPGSAKTGDVGKAIERAGKVLREALAETEGCELHLENTAGTGGTLGRSFEELGALIEAAGGDQRLGLCLDSCHLLASGYEIRTAEALEGVLAQCDAALGPKRLRSLHVNDSEQPLGSNRDRHANLGEGELADKGCAVFLSEPRFEDLPCVLETPGVDRSGVRAEDVALANRLRKRGLAARGRARRHATARRA